MNAAALLELAGVLAARSVPPVNSALLPSGVRTDSALPLIRMYVGQAVTYADFYRSVESRQRRVDDYLPALAFWIFNTPEQHVLGFSYMNGRENYVAGGYQFELLATSADSSAAVYRIAKQR
jgi:hypothetical protein